MIYCNYILFSSWKVKINQINSYFRIIASLTLWSLSRTLTFQKKFFFFFNGSLFKMMKNAFYFILKALFVLKIFNFLSWLFGHVKKKWLDSKEKVNFKIYDVTVWLTNNYKCPMPQDVKATRQWNLVT